MFEICLMPLSSHVVSEKILNVLKDAKCPAACSLFILFETGEILCLLGK